MHTSCRRHTGDVAAATRLTIAPALCVLAAMTAAAINLASATASDEADSDQPVTVEELGVLRERSASFEFTAGDREDQQVRMRVTQTPEGWQERLGNIRVAYLKQDSRGIVQPSQKLRDEGRETHFEPALLKVPAELRPGESHNQSGSINVHDLESGKHEHTGSYKHHIEVIGWRRVRLGNRQFRGMLIKRTTHFDFKLADAKVVTQAVYMPGVGLIYEKTNKTTKTLNVFPDEEVEAMKWLGDQVSSDSSSGEPADR